MYVIPSVHARAGGGPARRRPEAMQSLLLKSSLALGIVLNLQAARSSISCHDVAMATRSDEYQK